MKKDILKTKDQTSFKNVLKLIKVEARNIISKWRSFKRNFPWIMICTSYYNASCDDVRFFSSKFEVCIFKIFN